MVLILKDIFINFKDRNDLKTVYNPLSFFILEN
jgi:hypothetical protein